MTTTMKQTNLDSDLMKLMLERLPGFVYCVRTDLTTMKAEWLMLGHRAVEFFGIPLEELSADPWVCATTMTEAERTRFEEEVKRCAASGDRFAFVTKIVLRNGKERWLDWVASVESDGNSLLWYGQVLDITDRKELEESLRASERARAQSESLYRQLLDALPVGVMVANQQNQFLVMNPAQQRFSGGLTEHDGDVSKAYGVFCADGITPLPMEDTGMARCLRGETLEEEVVLRNPRLPNDVRLHVQWTPLEDEHGKTFAALGTSQEITLQRQLEDDLRSRNEELAASEQAKAALIERLRYSIDELSNPILEVWDDVLAMPLIGVVDSRRTADIVPRLLGEVTRTQASFVIIDLTGVELVDTKTADHLMKLMRKVEVVGARCVLTGIRPAVAETLVDIGVDFSRLTTLRNLKHGLREALRTSRQERASTTELEVHDQQDDARSRRS